MIGNHGLFINPSLYLLRRLPCHIRYTPTPGCYPRVLSCHSLQFRQGQRVTDLPQGPSGLPAHMCVRVTQT